MSFVAVPGTRIGDYVVVSEIGRGGMAVVYLADHPGLGRKVALKLLSPELAGDDGFRERFVREARLAAGIEHPNIVPVYDAGEIEGLLFIAMRYVEGTDLERVLKREGALSLDRSVEILSQISAALDAAHAKGLVHRDVKPSNVLIALGEGPRGGDHAYLADFGLARPQIGSDLTHAGELYGTLDYMAPEQLDGRPLDPRTDVYALACVAYECLTGEPPFRKESSLAKAAAHLRTRPAPPSELDADLSTQVDEAILRGLMKEKSARYSNCLQLVEALQEAVVGRPAGDTTVGTSFPKRVGVPVPLGTFVGRSREMSDLRRLFAAERLVSLVGSAGCGKTRLALEFARGLGARSSLCYIDVGAATEGSELLPMSAAALGIGGSQDDLAALVGHFQFQEATIILDNCDALLNVCAGVVTRLLSACPELHVLVTSREPLLVSGEATLPVPPLPVPRGGRVRLDAISSTDSVKLFLERARAARPTFQLTEENALAIAEICRRLDGLPLGLELAAAWVQSLSPEEIVERFVIKGGVLSSTLRAPEAHHRSLDEAIEWSFRLLSAEERLLIVRLSVFDGGFELRAAESISFDENLGRTQILPLLSGLVAKSLIRADQSIRRTRFRFLEPIRRHAEDLLVVSGERSKVEQRHAEYFIELVAQHDSSDIESSERGWVDDLRPDLPNMRKALRAAVGAAPPYAPLGLQGLRVAAGHVAYQLAEWDTAVNLLSPFADSGEPRILRELGAALTKRSGDRTGQDFMAGQQLLAGLATADDADPETIVILAGTWKGIDDSLAVGLYRRALELDPADSYALVNLLESEMALGRDHSIIEELNPSITDAALRCRNQIHDRKNEPWAAYDLGKLELLLDRSDEGIAAHLLATYQSSLPFMIETSLRSIDRLHASFSFPGYEEVRRLMVVSLAAKFPDHPVERMRSRESRAKTIPVSLPVLVLAGSSSREESESLEGLRPLLEEALRGESWTIISGGTSQGVSSLAAELALALAIDAVGYLPASLPMEVSKNDQYAEIRETSGTGFSLLEPLLYWEDLLASGIEPSDVCLLAVGGGPLSALEFRLALSLGATVGVVLESGGAAEDLLEDAWWKGVSRIVGLEPSRSAIVQFFRQFQER